MKNGRLSVGLALLVFPLVLLADDLQFSTSAAINFKNGKYIPKADPDTGFEFTNKTLDLGFTVFTSSYYVALNYDTTLTEDSSVVNKGTIEVDTERDDHGITVGHELGGGWGVFLGYKTGETIQDTVRTTGTSAFRISYFDKGPFAGVSFNRSFGKPGTFSASVAYANFDGTITRKDEIAVDRQHTGGTTSGLSYGIKWTKEIRDGTTIAIGYKRNNYRFKDEDDGFGSSQDLDQTFDIIYVQMSDYFD